MYTFEMYPAGVTSNSRFYPPDEIIKRETDRNKDAVLQIAEYASCPYTAIGKTRTHCGPLFDDFELSRGWTRDRLGTDTATAGRWEWGDAAATTYQPGNATSGYRVLSTGKAAGSSSSANDVDGGITTISSPLVRLPNHAVELYFRYSFGHSSSATSDDRFRAYVEREDGARTVVKAERGSPDVDRPAWAVAWVSLAPWAGQRIRIVFEAADLAGGSTIEAAVDDVRITRD
jgi:hypothetical protein